MRRSVLLGWMLVMAVAVSGCGLLQALEPEPLATRAVIIASCMQRWDPDAEATRIAQRAADQARDHAAEVEVKLAAQVRTMHAVRAARPYVEDAVANAPGVTALWTDFADHAARARAFRTDLVVAPDGLFALAEEALVHLEDAIDAYDRIAGDRLAVSVLGTWASRGRGSEPWIRELVQTTGEPADVAAVAFAHPDRAAVVRLGGALDRVAHRIGVRDDSGVIAALDELGERSRPVFGLADIEQPRLGESAGQLARSAVADLDALERAELSWLQGAAASYRLLERQLRRAEQAALEAQPDCLPTGPLLPDPDADPEEQTAPAAPAPRLSPAPAAAPTQ